MFRPLGSALILAALSSLGAAQDPFSPREAEALQHKQAGDYLAAGEAFANLLRDAPATRRGAAMAEYYATMALQMTQTSGAWDTLGDAADAALAAPLGQQHPTLAAQLRLLALRIAVARGDETAIGERTAAAGCLVDWWVLGPIDNERGAGFARAYPPETALDLAASLEGKKRPVRWRRIDVSGIPAGRVDLDAIHRPNDQVLCYVATCLWSDTDRNALLRLGSDEAFAVFVNGAEVGRRDVRRTFQHDQDLIPVALREGANLLVLKICEQEGAFEFAARLTELDGRPATGIRADADEDAMRTAAATRPADRDVAAPYLGARTLFAETAQSDPYDAFRLAYILASLRPDDPNERRDRELARFAVSQLPDEPSVHYLHAFTMLQPAQIAAEKDDNERRQVYERILERHPDHSQALVALAQMELENINATDRAEALLQRALAVNPNNVSARMMLARTLEAAKLPALAAREIERVGQTGIMRPPYPSARLAHGRKLAAHGHLADAIVCYRDALRDDYSFDSATSLAHLLVRRGQRDEAIEVLERAIRLEPFARSPRFRLAGIHEAEGDLDRALATLRAWLVLCPEDDDAIVHISRIHGIAGDTDRQREWLATALDLNPNRKNERRHLEFLQSDEVPFYAEFAVDGDAIIAADPGPPADSEESKDALYYLLDQRVVRAYRNGTTSEYHHEIRKMLSEEGVRRTTEHYVPHYWGEQRARLLETRVIKKNGDVLQPQIRGYYAKLPPLEIGDIVETRHRVDDVAPSFFGDYFGLEHGFVPSDGAPSNLSMLDVSLENGRDYGIQIANGAPEGVVAELEGGDRTYRFEMRGLPRRRIEVRAPIWAEREPLVRISTYRDWDQFGSWWWNLIRKQTDLSPAIREKVLELTAGLESDEDKIAAIYDFVTTEIRYTAWEFGVHGYKPYSTRVIFDRRHGDCKDKSILMNAMLSVVGIDAYPVLIRGDSPRSHDDLSLPIINHFNHCISYVAPGDGRPGMFLDGTATYHPVDTLPSMDQGADVVVINAGEGEVARVPWSTAEHNLDRRRFEISLTPTGDADVRLHQTPSGAAAVWLRESLGNEVAKREERLERRLSRSFGKVEVSDIECSELLDMNAPVELDVSFSAPKFAARQDDGLVLSGAFEQSNLSALIRAEDRQLPLLLGIPDAEATSVAYTLPEGYRPVELPAPTELDTRFGRYRMQWTLDGDTLRAEREQVLSTNRIEPADYPEFRAFVDSVQQADRRMVLIRKEGQR